MRFTFPPYGGWIPITSSMNPPIQILGCDMRIMSVILAAPTISVDDWPVRDSDTQHPLLNYLSWGCGETGEAQKRQSHDDWPCLRLLLRGMPG